MRSAFFGTGAVGHGYLYSSKAAAAAARLAEEGHPAADDVLNAQSRSRGPGNRSRCAVIGIGMGNDKISVT